jgi:hypothetical protein
VKKLLDAGKRATRSGGSGFNSFVGAVEIIPR